MTASENSVMTKKVRCSNLDLGAYPQLQELSKFVNLAAAQLLSEAIGAPVEADAVQSGMIELERAASEISPEAAVFTFPENARSNGAIVALAPSFVSSYAESQLGGGFSVQQEDKLLEIIEVELVREFVEALRIRINGYFRQNGFSSGFDILPSFQLADSLDVLASQGDTKVFFSVAVSGSVGETPSRPFASVFFPMNMLERLGVLEVQKKTVAPAEANDEWRAVMERNVLEFDLELGVILDRYTAMISDLSKLEVGDVVPLSENAQNALDISLRLSDGDVLLGKARLGVFKNKKAIKLEAALLPQAK